MDPQKMADLANQAISHNSQIIDANYIEKIGKERPNECFLKGSGVVKLTEAIRQLEAENRELREALSAELGISKTETATSPKKLVRLTDERVYALWPVDAYEFSQEAMNFARAIMDELEGINGA